METFTSIVVLLVVVLIARELRVGNAVARADATLQLQPRERFRTLRMQLLEPVLALVIVGSLLVTDLQRSPVHLLLALGGGAAGFAFGVYRARTTFVAAVPVHRGVILRYSIESFVALGILVVVKIVAEQDLLPEGEVFRAIIAALLGFLVVESCARVLMLVRYYRRDEHSTPELDA